MRYVIIIYLLLLGLLYKAQISYDSYFLDFGDEIQTSIKNIDNKKYAKLIFQGGFSFENKPFKYKKNKFDHESSSYFYTNDSVFIESRGNLKPKYWVIRNNKFLTFDRNKNRATVIKHSQSYKKKDSLQYKIVSYKDYDSINYYKREEYNNKKQIISSYTKYGQTIKLSKYNYRSPNNYFVNDYQIQNNDTSLTSITYVVKSKEYPSDFCKESYLEVNFTNNTIRLTIEDREYSYNNAGNIFRIRSIYSSSKQNIDTIICNEIKERGLKKVLNTFHYINLFENLETDIYELNIAYKKIKKKDSKTLKNNIN